MDTQRITAQIRLSNWGNIVKERMESGQGVNQFCEERGITRSAYYYWQKRVRESAYLKTLEAKSKNELVPGGWMELKENDKPVASGGALAIEVGIFNIKVDMDTDALLLSKVLRALVAL
ncbi:MAG: hypothetical protein LBE79_13075 [Tannerella sp.]|jgi:putative transposase|nr:hypothetical protein [Tannerella sp.]